MYYATEQSGKIAGKDDASGDGDFRFWCGRLNDGTPTEKASDVHVLVYGVSDNPIADVMVDIINGKIRVSVNSVEVWSPS